MFNGHDAKKENKKKELFSQTKRWTLVFYSVADPHHHVDPDPDPDFDADLDADPDPACHFDANPDPDPSFQIKVQSLD